MILRTAARPVLAAVLIAAAGCNKATTPTPTPSSLEGSLAVQVFTGAIDQEGEAFYSFTVARSGTISMMLLDLREGGAASSAEMQLGIGVPAGTGCFVSTGTATVAAGPTPQITRDSTPGVYCARITDVGNLSGPATFSINIGYPR
jgi:hypothetical protein